MGQVIADQGHAIVIGCRDALDYSCVAAVRVRAEHQVPHIGAIRGLDEDVLTIDESGRHAVAADSYPEAPTKQPEEEIEGPRTTNGPPTWMDGPLAH